MSVCVCMCVCVCVCVCVCSGLEIDCRRAKSQRHSFIRMTTTMMMMTRICLEARFV